MDRRQANEESRKPHPGSRSLRCVWYCGLINEQIRKAARLGEKSLEIRFPPKHYVVLHRDIFREQSISMQASRRNDIIWQKMILYM